MRPDWNIYHQPVASSSNDLALERIKSSPHNAHGCVFTVGEQTKGRGRQGKIWHSEPGDGLYMSVVLKPQLQPEYWPLLSFVSSLSMMHAMAETYPGLQGQLGLKWPNDIVTHDNLGQPRHKLAGVLLEAHQNHVIIGCGVNLKNAPQIEGKHYQPGDISLYHAGAGVSVDKLVTGFLSQLEKRFAQFEAGEHTELIAAWKNHCFMLGRSVSVTVGQSAISGIASDIYPTGALMLVDNQNNTHMITAGDVQLMGEVNDTDH